MTIARCRVTFTDGRDFDFAADVRTPPTLVPNPQAHDGLQYEYRLVLPPTAPMRIKRAFVDAQYNHAPCRVSLPSETGGSEEITALVASIDVGRAFDPDATMTVVLVAIGTPRWEAELGCAPVAAVR